MLDDISGGKAAGQKIDSSRLHPFPARMPLTLAEHIIENMTTSDTVILDPMVGSGTTMIAAKRLGRLGMGFDLDPLAVLMTRVSTRTYNVNDINQTKNHIFVNAQEIANQKRLSYFKQDLSKQCRDFVQYWFPPASQKQLFALAVSISQLQKSSLKDLAWVVFSSLIIAKSSGASYAMDISRSRPHKRLDKPLISPFDVWEERFDSLIKRLPFTTDNNHDTKIDVKEGDARSLNLADNSVDFVFTSPPYQNAVDYIRAHKFSLIWMGHNLDYLREIRGTMIGTERGLESLDGLPPKIETKLCQNLTEKPKQAKMRRYLSDLGKSLSEIGRVLYPNGLAVLVLGPTMINSKRSDAADVISRIGKKYGFVLVGQTIRSLNSVRRSLPPPAIVNKQNDMGQRMRREVLVALRKR